MTIAPEPLIKGILVLPQLRSFQDHWEFTNTHSLYVMLSSIQYRITPYPNFFPSRGYSELLFYGL